jgi:spermidine/putrescine transport system permease protein
MRDLRFWLLAPARLWMACLFAGPLLVIVSYSLLTRGSYGGVESPWTLENFSRLFHAVYLTILFRSLLLASAATLICVLLGFPLALFIARSGDRKNLYLQLVMLPFWTSFLVRTYAWMFLLRDTGLLNSVLLSAGVIREPLPLLYNAGAVLLGLVHAYLPFMVLPLYASIERIDPALLEAAADLGARPWSMLFRVVIPLAGPGITAGSVLVFIPCVGAYLTPDLLGGGKAIMVGNLIQNQFTTARDWPFGSAVSIALMALAWILLAVIRRRPSGGLL